MRSSQYKENHSVCPLVGIGTLPTPLSAASVPLLPELGGGGGGHLLAGEGLGESQFQRMEKKPSTLPTLWITLRATMFHEDGGGGGGTVQYTAKSGKILERR
jgi:hypothetical protein